MLRYQKSIHILLLALFGVGIGSISYYETMVHCTAQKCEEVDPIKPVNHWVPEQIDFDEQVSSTSKPVDVLIPEDQLPECSPIVLEIKLEMASFASIWV